MSKFAYYINFRGYSRLNTLITTYETTKEVIEQHINEIRENPSLIENNAIFLLHTPLHLSIMMNSFDIFTLLLREEDINLNLKNFKGQTCCHLIAELPNNEALKFFTQLFTIRPKQGSELVRQLDYNGRTVLHSIVEKSYDDCIKLLLWVNNEELFVNSKEHTYGDTALHIAVKNEDITALNILLDNRANPNLKNNLGKGAIFYSTMSEMSDILENLLAKDVQFQKAKEIDDANNDTDDTDANNDTDNTNNDTDDTDNIEE